MKRDIFKVFSSNLIKMFVTFITAFIVPMVLSVDGYGYYKVYTFYASYIGVLHLGFCDGIYLEYGGKNDEDINKKSLAQKLATLFLYLLIITLGICSVGVVKHDFTIFCLGIIVVPNIMFTFYSYIYQSIGNFKKYTLILNCSTVSELVINLILVVLRVTNYRVYIVAYVLVQVIAFMAGTLLFKKSNWIKIYGFSKDIFLKYIKMGILLMVGNFAYTIFIGIDKWFIQFTMNVTTFSMYSFASQMLTVVNMFITPLSMTLYSHLSRRHDKEFVMKVKKLLISVLMLMPLAIYVILFIVKTFMVKYDGASNLIILLLITQIFLSINLAIFVNLYKVYKLQNKYFINLMKVLAVATVLDLIVATIRPNATMYAIATLISCLIWLGINMLSFRYLIPKVREILYVVGLLGVFFATSVIDNILIRFVIYLPIYLIMTIGLMPEEWQYVKQQIINLGELIHNK